MIEIIVYGTPAPQGSKRHVGKGIMIEASQKVKPWREAVKWAVRESERRMRPEVPLCVDITFTLVKPASAPKRARSWPMRKPDLDKLVRSTFDALTESGVWQDDARVVEVSAMKCFPVEGVRALASPGAWIRIREVTVNE